jgi:DNA-nicking Smr family endonuclease
MGGKRKIKRDVRVASERKPSLGSPFSDLPRLIREHRIAEAKAANVVAVGQRPAPQKPKPTGLPSGVDAPTDESEILRAAYDGVRPLGSGSTRIETPPPASRAVISEEAEVLAELSDLVAGLRPFELTETDEYVEGFRLGVDPRLVTRLRRGEFALQGHLDMHGMTRVDAHAALSKFIIESVRKGRRTVLVVHGRGRGSPGGTPVLKHATAHWLSHGTAGGYVLAFTTARPSDGGAGAMYVLLRRERRRGRFEVLNGTHLRD